MATITYAGNSYTVDHAVKGTDYVHGYDASGNLLISIEGVNNFSGITYSGTYLDPDECLQETCNEVRYIDGAFKTRGGSSITLHVSDISDAGNVASLSYTKSGSSLQLSDGNNLYPEVSAPGTGLAIAKGGTGATTVADARTNLIVAEKPRVLWSSSGTDWSTEEDENELTINNFNDYAEWEFITDIGVSFTAWNCGDNAPIQCGKSYPSTDADGTRHTVFVAITRSGNTLTLVSCYDWYWYGETSESRTITKIIGLMKKSDIITPSN